MLRDSGCSVQWGHDPKHIDISTGSKILKLGLQGLLYTWDYDTKQDMVE